MVADCAELGGVELSTVKIVAAQVDVVVLEMAFDVSSCGLYASQLTDLTIWTLWFLRGRADDRSTARTLSVSGDRCP